MITKITTKIPDSNEYKRSLNSNYSGKWYSFLSLAFGLPFLWLGNEISGNKQNITIYLSVLLLIYLFVPALYYMKGYFRFFLNSWIVGLITIILFLCNAILIAYNVTAYAPYVNIYAIIIFVIVFIINIIKERGKLQKYKSMILGSIKDEEFHIDVWLDKLKSTGVDQGMDFALSVMLIIGGVVIVGGSIFGSGLMTVKILLNSGFDFIVEAIMSLGVLMISMLILSRFTNETLKLIAAYQVKKELIQE